MKMPSPAELCSGSFLREFEWLKLSKRNVNEAKVEFQERIGRFKEVQNGRKR